MQDCTKAIRVVDELNGRQTVLLDLKGNLIDAAAALLAKSQLAHHRSQHLIAGSGLLVDQPVYFHLRQKSAWVGDLDAIVIEFNLHTAVRAAIVPVHDGVYHKFSNGIFGINRPRFAGRLLEHLRLWDKTAYFLDEPVKTMDKAFGIEDLPLGAQLGSSSVLRELDAKALASGNRFKVPGGNKDTEIGENHPLRTPNRKPEISHGLSLLPGRVGQWFSKALTDRRDI